MVTSATHSKRCNGMLLLLLLLLLYTLTVRVDRWLTSQEYWVSVWSTVLELQQDSWNHSRIRSDHTHTNALLPYRAVRHACIPAGLTYLNHRRRPPSVRVSLAAARVRWVSEYWVAAANNWVKFNAIARCKSNRPTLQQRRANSDNSPTPS